MLDVMVDLETLGTVPGCVILSIGAIDFDNAGVGINSHYTVINTASCVEAFLTVDPKTKKWWDDQDDAARKVVREAEISTTSLTKALEYFNNYLRRMGPDVRVWGNGADFDNAILQVAYDAVKIKPAWKFYNGRCYRTLKNLVDVPLERVGTYHNALDDAKSQAAHAVKLLAIINSGNSSGDMSALASKYLDFGLNPQEMADLDTVSADVRALAGSVLSQS